MNKEFMVVFEVGPKSLGAFAPDIPGCFAMGRTLDQTRRRYLEAAEAHLKWMAADHDPLPKPTATAFDFAPRVSGKKPGYYVEWLQVPMPRARTSIKTTRAA
jgi:predicted RNase H-like HicB family nuclease